MQALKPIIFSFLFLIFVSFGPAQAQQSAQLPITSQAIAADASTDEWNLYFGGPDKPAYHLRDVIGDWIDAQPAGARIHFALYYFRDPVIADKLIAAHDRGVSVNLVIEATPRQKNANLGIISKLEQAGLSQSIYLDPTSKVIKKGKLHSKIFAFSHPAPTVMIGSFNLSGSNDVDDPFLAKTGDQDRGHNLLLQTYEETLVNRLVAYVENLSGESDAPGDPKFAETVVWTEDDALFMFPRRDKDIAVEEISGAAEGAKITGAISHMKWHPMIGAFKQAAKNGAEVNLVVHETNRRVPQRVVNNLRRAGVNIRRYKKGETYPMHAKFLLLEDGEQKISWLGSYNWNSASRKRNKEVLLESRDPALYDALAARFEVISGEIESSDASND